MLFDKQTYVERRRLLSQKVGSGLILLMGNNDAPANYPNNAYRFRQDSSFLYFFGQHREGLAGIIDIDNNREYLVGDDIDIDDIVWYGSVMSVADMAAESGVAQTMPMSALPDFVGKAKASGQRIHFLPPYRHDTMIQLMDMLDIHPSQQREAASIELIKAVVSLRSVKSQGEIAEIERACAIGYEMHTTAMQMCREGVTEQARGHWKQDACSSAMQEPRPTRTIAATTLAPCPSAASSPSASRRYTTSSRTATTMP